MRKAPAVLILGLTVPVLSALPVLSPPAARPKPVTPHVHELALAGVDAGALSSSAGRSSLAASQKARAELTDPAARGNAPAARPLVLTAARTTSKFELVGVTWRNGSAHDVTVLVRTHTGGTWTGWSSLDQASVGTEQVRSARTGTEPYFAGPSDGVQVRVDVRAGRAPADLRVELVDPGDSAADAQVGQTPPAAASAAIGMPTIYTRAQWGADESLRNGGPRYSTTIKGGFVHHTDGANGYSSADVPKIIRGIYAYHVLSNGWSDIGYNFLVDRFGRIWEGRYGGMDRPVIGAHTAGFNTDTFGVAAIGDYDTTAAPSAMLSGIARVMAWKLSLHYRNPNGTMTLTSGGGDTNRYPAGTVVTKPTISAHRDMGYTACPGQYLYAQLATIRSEAASYMGAGLVNPSSSAIQAPYGGSPITFTSGVLRYQGWRLELHERCSGRVVRAFSGTASTSSPIRTVWDLRDGNGAFVRPGVYDATLTTWSGSLTGRPWTQPITVTTTTPTTSVSPVASSGDSSFVAVNPQRIYDSRTGGAQPLGPQGKVDIKVLGAGGVPAGGVAAVALNVTGTCPTANTYFTVWPAGVARPNSSSLNLTAGSTRAALTVSAVGGDGSVSIANAFGLADVVVDVVGYYPSDPGAGDRFHPAAPFRLYDSRTSDGPIASGQTRTLTLPTLDGVAPSQMTAAIVNVTAVDAKGPGYLRVYPAGTTPPATSTLNYATAAPIANRAVTRLSSGRLTVGDFGAATDFVIDVVGWYAPAATGGGSLYHALTPSRVLDTRTGLGAPQAALTGGSTLDVVVAGNGQPVPAGASAVVMTLTSTDATVSTYLTAWPSGLARPATSDVNVTAPEVTANLVVVPVGSGGKVSLFNQLGATQLVGDVVGYYQ